MRQFQAKIFIVFTQEKEESFSVSLYNEAAQTAPILNLTYLTKRKPRLADEKQNNSSAVTQSFLLVLPKAGAISGEW